MRTAALFLVAMATAGCRMAPQLEAPHIRSSEFGLPLARAGTLHESDIGRWNETKIKLAWPATLAVLQVHRDNRYVALAQGNWDKIIGESGAIEVVNILDGLGVGDESLHSQVARHDEPRGGPREVDPKQNSLFMSERWIASASGSDLTFLYATKVATDTYWNAWAASYFLILPAPFVPAEEQTAQAVAKGFLVDVKTGKIIATAGGEAMKSRTANPVIVMHPLFQLEQAVAREAETRMIEQLSRKLRELRGRTE